eukprot:jgi/Chrpa1/6217/Chrysochromulina_OHIO_Genome00005048-RA
MLLGLRLANLAPPMRDDAASLGPGAKVSLYTILHLLREGVYVPSYQLKPKMVGSLGTFDMKRWFTWVSHDLELAMGFYLDARVGGEPELAAVAEFARAHFRNNPSIAVESMLCEAAFAYGRKLIARLGKGSFTEAERARFAALALADDAPSAADRTRLVRDDALGLTAVTLKTLMEETSAAE